MNVALRYCSVFLLPLLMTFYASTADHLIAPQFAIDRITEFTGGEANELSRNVAVSANGNFVVFESYASNLIAGDTNQAQDIFLYDISADSFERVSVDSSGNEADANSYSPSVSSDGRYVVFHSFAGNLIPSDTNGKTDVFLRDRTEDTTIRISESGAGAEANHMSFHPSISDDGDKIVFISRATNLVSGDTNSSDDVFVYDLSAGTTTLVSKDSSGTIGNADSIDAKVSGNGEHVVFSSKATNLIVSDTNDCSDVFVHQISTSTTAVKSKNASGTLGNRLSHQADISDDGRFVVFTSKANNLSTTDTNNYTDIFIHDSNTSVTELVSLSESGSQVSGRSSNSSISGDGRYISFSSTATDVVSSDANGKMDIFVHDRDSVSTQLVSQSLGNSIGNKGSEKSFIWDDGAKIAFTSSASNLVSSDTNNQKDIFIKDNALAGAIVEVTSLSATLAEESASTVQFKFKRYNNLTTSLTANFTLSGSTTSGLDYVDPGSSIVFPENIDEVTLTITLSNDSEVENTESLVVSIDESNNYVVSSKSTAQTDITDTDRFVVQVASTTTFMYEEDEEPGLIVISRSGGSLGNLSVPYTISGTAVNGTDYESLSGQSVIPDGESSVTVSVTPIDDELNESDESMGLALDSSASYDLGGSTNVSITLKDNDAAKISLVASDPVAIEKASAETASFVISREVASSESVTINYTMRGSATNGVDYQTLNESITIAANETSATITVTPINDSQIEPVETVILEVLPGAFYELTTASMATVVIKDEEDAPTVSIVASDDSGDETGNTMSFDISRTGSTTGNLAVEFSISGTAINGTDYQSLTSSATILNGQSSVSVLVTPLDDALAESTESVVLSIKSSVNYFVSQTEGKASAQILDDETPLVGIKATSSVALEVDPSRPAEFEVYRTGDLSQSLTVNLGIGGSATNGVDFSSIANSVTLPAGDRSASILVTPLADSGAFEGNETVEISISSGGSYNLASDTEARVVIADAVKKVEKNTVSSNGNSYAPHMRQTKVAFSSKATNLIDDDLNAKEDVFWFDIATESIQRVQRPNISPNGTSRNAKISNNGRYIVFESKATNLVGADVIDSHSDIFIYDTSSGDIEKLAQELNIEPNSDSFHPSVSEDGRYVVFESKASNLVAGDTNTVSDVFLVDRENKSIERVSEGASSEQLLGASRYPSINHYGDKIVFQSHSLENGTASTESQVFYKKRGVAGTTILTKNTDNELGDKSSYKPQISGNGQLVVFESHASNLIISGRNGFKNILSYDFLNSKVSLISSTSNGLNLDSDSYGASVSAAGRYVSFITRASNLSSDSENCVARPVIKDRITSEIRSLYSRQGTDCGAGATTTSLSSDGRSLAIGTRTSHIIAEDSNNLSDIFLFSNSLTRNILFVKPWVLLVSGGLK